MKLQLRIEGEQFLPGFMEYDNLKEYERPSNSAQKFCNFQRDWLQSKDREAWANMWEILLDLCGKALTKELHRTGFRMPMAKRRSVALDATVFLLERYRYSGYRLKHPATCARLAVRHMLYEVKDPAEVERETANLMNELMLTNCEDTLSVLAAGRLHAVQRKDDDQLYLDFGGNNEA